MRPKQRHLLLVAAALFATLAHFANAQTDSLLANSSLASDSARSTSTSIANQSLNRIIIKFKSGDTPKASSAQYEVDPIIKTDLRVV